MDFSLNLGALDEGKLVKIDENNRVIGIGQNLFFREEENSTSQK